MMNDFGLSISVSNLLSYKRTLGAHLNASISNNLLNR